MMTLHIYTPMAEGHADDILRRATLILMPDATGHIRHAAALSCATPLSAPARQCASEMDMDTIQSYYYEIR